ncbi:MAG: hypothetical protein AAFV46_05495, partial [Cyanobacteria bacterium J06635_11]
VTLIAPDGEIIQQSSFADIQKTLRLRPADLPASHERLVDFSGSRAEFRWQVCLYQNWRHNLESQYEHGRTQASC